MTKLLTLEAYLLRVKDLLEKCRLLLHGRERDVPLELVNLYALLSENYSRLGDYRAALRILDLANSQIQTLSPMSTTLVPWKWIVYFRFRRITTRRDAGDIVVRTSHHEPTLSRQKTENATTKRTETEFDPFCSSISFPRRFTDRSIPHPVRLFSFFPP